MSPMAHGSSRRWFNPLEWLTRYCEAKEIPDAGVALAHIIYDPTLAAPDFRIIRGQVHDGLVAYTDQLIGSTLLALVRREPYPAQRPPDDWDRVADMHYTVGMARLATVFGMVELPCSTTQRYPGQHERLTIPVRCTYVYAETP